jgi:hypothetical protein
MKISVAIKLNMMSKFVSKINLIMKNFYVFNTIFIYKSIFIVSITLISLIYSFILSHSKVFNNYIYFNSYKNEPHDIAILEFSFIIEKYSPNQNIFQTSNANNGIRLEVSPEGFIELISYDHFYGIKHCTFYDKFELNNEYKFFLRYDSFNRDIISNINNSRICYFKEFGLVPSFDHLILGNGGWWNRIFYGKIKNFNFYTFSNPQW